MPILELNTNGIATLKQSTFARFKIDERKDLQRLLRENFKVIDRDILIISEEFSNWQDSKRRIDLLGVDKLGNLAVIELKRTEDGGHMDLQAIRYAAMVSTLTFDQAVEAFSVHLTKMGKSEDARALLLEHLESEAPDENFAKDVRILLISQNFLSEITSSALWLRQYKIDIRCIRLTPYEFDGKLLIDAQEIIPLQVAEEYQVKLREKTATERAERAYNIDFTRYDIQVDGKTYPNQWKRNAIYLICRCLVESDVTPEQIAELFYWRPKRIWFFVDGDADEDKFNQLARAKAEREESTFNPKRWFCENDELLKLSGKTFAFSNQWGGRWLEAMELLKTKFPEHKIEFKAVSSEDD